MGSELIYSTSKDVQPFIRFDVEIKPSQVISCVGYEFICSNLKCDCQSVHIGVGLKGKDYKSILTYITYGWRNYDYYLSRGHSKDHAQEIVQGTFNKQSDAESEQNKSILLAFRRWLGKNKEYYDQIFAERYQQHKSAVRNRQMSKERNAKLKKLFSLMMELFGEEKVEEFIASCEQQNKISYTSDYKKARR
jgi:hypothetical protein